MRRSMLPPQQIHRLALLEPAMGYAASPRFKRAPVVCPKCRSTVYYRHNRLSTTPLGATCSKCPWVSTFPMKPEQFDPPHTDDFPNLPPHEKAPPKGGSA